jgi:hypothetical protein
MTERDPSNDKTRAERGFCYSAERQGFEPWIIYWQRNKISSF